MLSRQNTLLWIFTLLLNLVPQIFSQTLSTQYNLYSPTTTTYTTNSLASTQSWYLDSNGREGGDDCRMVGMGYIFEGDEFCCTYQSTPADINLDTSGDFAVDVWIYMTDVSTTEEQAIVCKYYPQSSGAGGYYNQRFCIIADTNGQILVKSAFLCNQIIDLFEQELSSQYKQYLIHNFKQFTASRQLQLNQQFTEGWNHVVVNFYHTTSGAATKTSLTGYLQDDYGNTYTDSASNVFNFQLSDVSNGILCSGGTMDGSSYSAGPSTIIDPNMDFDSFAILGQVQFYHSGYLSAAQVATKYSTSCAQSYLCKICFTSGGSCLQTLTDYNFQYDLDTATTYVSTIADTAGGSTLYVDPDFSYTPIFAHSQGMYFDPAFSGSDQYINTNAAQSWGSDTSFTIEAWVRPNQVPSSNMHIYEKLSSASSNYVDLYFSNNNKLYFDLNGNTVQLNVQWTSSYSDGEWVMIAATVRKINPSTTNICVYISGKTLTCSNSVSTQFADSGTMISRVGYKYEGYISNVYVYDYPKVQNDLDRMWTTTCTAYKGCTCNYCPSETGVCLPTYNYGYTDQGVACYANCRSCWGSGYNECFSCNTGWTFDYVNTCESSCGDSIKDDAEDCDDGNTASGDGCSSACVTESGYICFGGSFTNADTCYSDCGDGISTSSTDCDDSNAINTDGCTNYCGVQTGYTCTGSPSSCTATCGDGLKVGSEGCDDGNTVSGDGCSSSCVVETGYNCTGGSVVQKDTCIEICGDGLDKGSYGCDDGNTVNLDGCNRWCVVETGYTCSGGTSTSADTCTPICGDGRLMSGEACDDGDTTSGDGCSSTCAIETGYQCLYGDSYNPDICTPICGDSKKVGTEACDDGNTAINDGCHSDCTVEIGYICSGGSSTTADTCTEICGDGKNFGTYACDDGNTVNGDGCSSTCTVETSYSCTSGDYYTASICTRTCDGYRQFEDMCDDGNTVSGDGCDQCCQREIGYGCTGGSTTSSDTCTEYCGDGRKMSLLACDDGNTVSGDGCSSVCKIETGYTCSGGTVFTPDVCAEKCGDGKNMGSYGCDDGNNANFDGCSATCQVEYGYTCSGGSKTKADTCTETCGDGKKMGQLACDDGNTVSGDGCSSKCAVETGWSCSQGNFYAPDICYEICGDGKNMGQYSCDDGNTRDGDGCSSTCAVESGYACSGGSSNKKDTCYKLSAPKITSAYFSSNNKYIYLNFNESVYIQSYWNLTNSWSFEMTGPLGKENYVFSWNISNIASYKSTLVGYTQFIIDFSCTQQLFGHNIEKVRIDFNDQTNVRSVSTKAYMINTTVTVFPYGQEDTTGTSDYNSGVCGYPTILGAITQFCIYGSFGIGFLAALFGQSMTDIWNMMGTLQTIYFFPVMNLYLPSCMTQYVWNFKISMPESDGLAMSLFDGLTNHTYMSIINPTPGYQYDKMGFESTAFLYIGADILSLAVYLFIVNCILSLLQMTFDESEFFRNVLDRFKQSVAVAYIQFGFLKLSFISQLNIKNLTVTDAQTGLSSLLAIFVIVGLYSYMFYIGFQGFKFQKEIKALRQQEKEQSQKLFGKTKRGLLTQLNNLMDKKEAEKQLTEQEIRDKIYYRGHILFEDYTITPGHFPYSMMYPALLCLKKLILIAILVTNSYETQLIGFLITHIASITAIYLIHPHQNPILNSQAILNELILFLIFMQAHMFTPRTYIDMTQLTTQAKNMLFLIMAAVFLNTVIVFANKVQILMKCRTLFRKKPDQIPIKISYNLQDSQAGVKLSELEKARLPINKPANVDTDKAPTTETNKPSIIAGPKNTSTNPFQKTNDDLLSATRSQTQPIVNRSVPVQGKGFTLPQKTKRYNESSYEDEGSYNSEELESYSEEFSRDSGSFEDSQYSKRYRK